MAMRLETESVRKILMNMMRECDLYGSEGKDAEAMVHYIAGMIDMANAVVEAIRELGGK